MSLKMIHVAALLHTKVAKSHPAINVMSITSLMFILSMCV